MKTFLITLLIACSIHASSQEYIPFTDSIATWNEGLSYWDDQGENGEDNGYSYHMEGDTLVNDTLYSKMFLRLAWGHDYASYNLDTPDEYIYSNHYNSSAPYYLIGGVREDEDKKVWFKNFNDVDWWSQLWIFNNESFPEEEIILYDFGMEIGDSILAHGVNGEELWYLTEITTGFLDRSKYIFETNTGINSDFQFWIEGIGSLGAGPFSIYQFVGNTLGGSRLLTCFNENNEPVYIIGGFIYCNCEGNNNGNPSLFLPYSPFPDSTAIWGVVNSDISENEDYGGVVGFNYKLEGDTILNNLTYSKLYTRISWGSEWNPDGQGYESLNQTDSPYEIVGFIREDNTKKVWFKSAPTSDWWNNNFGSYMIDYNLTIDESFPSDEILLYDFNLTVGDSIPLLNAQLALEYFTLENIALGLADRRNFTLVSSDGEEEILWIEGVGGKSHGLFSMFTETENTSNLVCFSVNGEFIYVNESETYIDLIGCEGPNLNTPVPECNATISGHVFFDSNNNGIFDTDEVTLQYPTIDVNNESFSIGNIEGRYIDCVEEGSTIITLQNTPLYHETVPNSLTVNVNENDTLEDLDIALVAIPDINDLFIEIFTPTPDRPGFDNTYYIDYSNIGTECVNDVTIEFNAPNNATLLEAIGGSSSQIIGQTANIEIGTLCPGQNGQITINIIIGETTAIGEVLIYYAEILPIDGDENVTDNTISYESVVVGAYDPNDKMVDFESIDSLFIAEERELTYLIRFQNTGNYYAENVRITDVIAQNLILETFELVDASHPVNAYVENNEIVFNFPNIFLPSEDDDEEGSNGFVRFRIQPSNDFLESEIIENTAAIYFDFNEPIITNTIVTTWAIPDGISKIDNSGIAVYPNPTYDFIRISDKTNRVRSYKVYDSVGRLIEISAMTNDEIKLGHFEKGLYHIELLDMKNETIALRKLIKL